MTGLPRSRTKWFSAYFDGFPGITGLHEPLNGLKARSQFYDLMLENVIACDCGLFITDFQKRWPEAPTLIIDRDIEDVYRSLCDFMPKVGMPRPSREILQQVAEGLRGLRGLRVRFDEINNRLEEITNYFGLEFDSAYALQLIKTNIQASTLKVNSESVAIWEK